MVAVTVTAPSFNAQRFAILCLRLRYAAQHKDTVLVLAILVELKELKARA